MRLIDYSNKSMSSVPRMNQHGNITFYLNFGDVEAEKMAQSISICHTSMRT